MAALLGRLLHRNDELSQVELTFLTKEGCHLCDIALDTIDRLRRRHPFQVRVVKMTEGDELYHKYSDKVPVGLICGTVVFTYRVSPDALLIALRNAADDAEAREDREAPDR